MKGLNLNLEKHRNIYDPTLNFSPLSSLFLPKIELKVILYPKLYPVLQLYIKFVICDNSRLFRRTNKRYCGAKT